MNELLNELMKFDELKIVIMVLTRVHRSNMSE